MAEDQVDPWTRARTHLRRRDAVLRPIITSVGPCRLQPMTDLFGALFRSIVAQQISTKAAASIGAKVIAGPCRGVLTPANLLAAPETELQAAGLSTAKRRSLHDLASRIVAGSLRSRRPATAASASIYSISTTMKAGCSGWIRASAMRRHQLLS